MSSVVVVSYISKLPIAEARREAEAIVAELSKRQHVKHAGIDHFARPRRLTK